MVLGAAAAAAAGGTLFEYNRKNFMYDRKMRQETEYQIMEFRIKQAELWREDVRDIIGLTSVKMDTYLVVNAVQLGFCVMAFCEGRLASGTPTWLIGCHTLSLAGAFMYLLMSIWLSMHASVAAKSYEVRLLTQLVRLPVPSWAQLEGARTYGSGFEKIDPKQMFRVPFAMGTQESVLESSQPHDHSGVGAISHASPAATGEEEHSHHTTDEQENVEAANGSNTADLWGLERRGDSIYELDGKVRADPMNMRHLKLVQAAMQYWQSYDGFARVAMSMGTNQLVTALAYYVIGYVLVSNHAVIASWLVVMLFMVIAAALIRLDMSLTAFEYRISVILVISGPCLSAVAAEQWSQHTVDADGVVGVLTPIVYMIHALWLMFLLHISNVSEQTSGTLLPTGFRSVMYIDVFGWIKRYTEQQNQRRASAASLEAPSPVDVNTKTVGKGPAVQAVRYEHGLPVPSRPEELPGAARPAPTVECLKWEDFEPSTFVPRERDNEKDRRGGSSSSQQPSKTSRPGFVPWRIFCAATVVLITLWWISGVFVLLTSFGIETFKVAPLLHEPGEELIYKREASFIQLASQLEGGELISTNLPHMRIQPHGLACNDNGGHAIVLSSRFGLFSTQLSGEVPKSHIEFRATPPCEGIEGELLQDVTLSCGSTQSSDACHALVLHRQGQQLALCPLFESTVEPHHTENNTLKSPLVMSVADAWLGEGNVAEDAPQEEITSITLANWCHEGGDHCAYVETSGRRIVEVQAGLDPSSASKQEWFPTRTLQTDLSGQAGLQGGALHLLGEQYLGVMQPNKQQFEVLDPRDGTLLGQWQLPDSQIWGAMCSMGNSLYFLSESASPELWRFPVPEQFQKRLPQPRALGSSVMSNSRQATLAPASAFLGESHNRRNSV